MTSLADPTPPSTGGYRKGEEARQRILDAALEVFGADGFRGATTRRIAEAASVNLPALKYYFGGKEGLYRACAREIVGRYEVRMLDHLSGVVADLRGPMAPARARSHLKSVMAMLAELLVASEESQIWTAFVLREMADRGPAFDILYAQVWSPGVDLIAALVARARAQTTATASDRIQALLLISSLSAFSIARPVAMKYLDWPDTDADRFASILDVIERQIDGLT